MVSSSGPGGEELCVAVLRRPRRDRWTVVGRLVKLSALVGLKVDAVVGRNLVFPAGAGAAELDSVPTGYAWT